MKTNASILFFAALASTAFASPIAQGSPDAEPTNTQLNARTIPTNTAHPAIPLNDRRDINDSAAAATITNTPVARDADAEAAHTTSSVHTEPVPKAERDEIVTITTANKPTTLTLDFRDHIVSISTATEPVTIDARDAFATDIPLSRDPSTENQRRDAAVTTTSEVGEPPVATATTSTA